MTTYLFVSYLLNTETSSLMLVSSLTCFGLHGSVLVRTQHWNIQWFHTYKRWNTILNSRLLFGKSCLTWFCSHNCCLKMFRHPVKISSGFRLITVGMPPRTAVCLCWHVVVYLVPVVSPPAPSQTVVSRLSVVLPTNYPSPPPPPDMTVTSCASNLSVIWHAL